MQSLESVGKRDRLKPKRCSPVMDSRFLRRVMTTSLGRAGADLWTAQIALPIVRAALEIFESRWGRRIRGNSESEGDGCSMESRGVIAGNPAMTLIDAGNTDDKGLRFSLTINPTAANRFLAGSGHTVAELLADAD